MIRVRHARELKHGQRHKAEKKKKGSGSKNTLAFHDVAIGAAKFSAIQVHPGFSFKKRRMVQQT